MSREEPGKLFWYRIKLIALVLVFLSPFIGGWLALYVFEIRPQSGNYGELIQPVRKLSWPPLASVDGAVIEAGFGRRWTLLLFSADACSEKCRSNLFYMRQIRTLLGRNTQRLQNVFISAIPLSEEMKGFLQAYPNFVVIENNQDERLYRQFRLPGYERVGQSGKMYLVDPDQNLMMHYPEENLQHRVLEDIRKLMKLSQIG